MIPQFSPKADIYLDDGSQHLMRAYGTYQTMLQNGNCNVLANFSNGFGYSWNLFYGPFSTDCVILRKNDSSIVCAKFKNGILFDFIFCRILYVSTCV